MKQAITLSIGLLVVVSVVFALSCGGGGEGVTEEPSATYKVGDTVEYKNHTVTLESVEVEEDIYLVISMTVRNTGSGVFDVAPESLLQVEDSEGRQGDFYHVYVYGKGSIGGTLRGGESMSGKTAFKIEAGATGIKIYYQPPDEARVIFEVE